MTSRVSLICILALLFICFFASSALAATMTGKNIKLNLQFKTQTSTYSGTVPSPGEATVSTQGEEPEIEKRLYSITLGYQSTDRSPIGISVSPKTVDFGSLNPTQAVTRIQTVTVQKGPVPVYTLSISEDHLPQDASDSGKFIPNTTGDKDKITTDIGGIWINPLTYGFGYRTDLEPEDSYKQFPSLENGLSRVPILKNSEEDKEINIVQKININNTQTDTVYQNTIYYTLIPTL